MLNCPKCGEGIEVGMKFCSHCGAPVLQKPVDAERVESEMALGGQDVKKVGGQEVKAPLPGTVLRISAATGTEVDKGDEILVMDVMKMEAPVTAPCDGTVTIMVSTMDDVATGDVLAVIR